jgi:hypothetical protein
MAGTAAGKMLGLHMAGGTLHNVTPLPPTFREESERQESPYIFFLA